MTHLSLEASKKVFEIVGEYETEQNYSEQAEPDCRCGEHGDPGYILTPKPNFAELIRLLPKIGEKKRWIGSKGVGRMIGAFTPDIVFSPSLATVAREITKMYMRVPEEERGMKAVEDYLMKLL